MPAALPYAFLSDEDAHGLNARNQILTAILAVFIWDFFTSLPEDARMRATHRFTFPCFPYVLSRAFTFMSLVYATVYAARPLENCERHDVAISVLTILAGASSTMLVLLRARAAFNKNLAATTAGAVIWGTHIVLTCVADFAIQEATAGPIASTGFCSPSGANRFHVAANAVLLVLHAFVCIGMSLRLGSGYLSIMRKFEISVLGRGLPPFSKGMLRDGQLYFVVSTITTSVCIIMAAHFPQSPYFSSSFALPNFAIMTILGCRIYRNTKVDGYQGPPDRCHFEMDDLAFAVNPALSTFDGDLLQTCSNRTAFEPGSKTDKV
ncbi:hypothetical protein BKA70DRAFT_1264700 [Coprinopsis sp. MPI-PUGE-AT-0042]|nr:hypothetical protein BKA70DRAFT_1264700 [Coprinopsis sp. MPI-PUGE-AT-0042]